MLTTATTATTKSRWSRRRFLWGMKMGKIAKWECCSREWNETNVNGPLTHHKWVWGEFSFINRSSLYAGLFAADVAAVCLLVFLENIYNLNGAWYYMKSEGNTHVCLIIDTICELRRVYYFCCWCWWFYYFFFSLFFLSLAHTICVPLFFIPFCALSTYFCQQFFSHFFLLFCIAALGEMWTTYV